MRSIRLAAIAALFASPCLAQGGRGGMPSDIDVVMFLQTLQVANAPALAPAINAILTDNSNGHMNMAPSKKGTAADTARAKQIVTDARAALSKYTDVAVAEKDGYMKFLPWLEDQAVYHYNNIQNAIASYSGFDATKPVSLLYRKESGKMILVGAMYNAAASATPEQLDSRLPLGVAHWHEHVNFCAPIVAPNDTSAVSKYADGAVMAKWLGISDREACRAAQGMFIPRMFGWMAHVYLFAGDDPEAIWVGDEHNHMLMRKGGGSL